MTHEERLEKIESYGKAYDKLVDALRQLPREMWQFKSSEEDWSVHELLIHILDSETNSYLRCRKCIAEPGSAVTAYDGDRWAQVLRYHDQNPDLAVETFKWLRSSTYVLIKDLPEDTWSNTIEHPENGTMTLDDWLDTYERHIPEHIEQMWAVYREWVQRDW